MGRKERRRRRTILKAAGYTAAAFGAYYLGKKLLGGQMKKGTGNGDVTGDTSPMSGEGGFSDASEEGVFEETPQGQMGMFGGGGDGKILGMPPLVLLGVGAALFLLYKK